MWPLIVSIFLFNSHLEFIEASIISSMDQLENKIPVFTEDLQTRSTIVIFLI